MNNRNKFFVTGSQWNRLGFIFVLLLLIMLVMQGCATQIYVPRYGSPGFWMGLLHGIIAPFSLIGSFLNKISFFEQFSVLYKIRIYAVPNSGIWYDAGFVLGLMFVAGGGSAASTKTYRIRFR